MADSRILAELMKTYLLDDDNKQAPEKETESQAVTRSIINILERPRLHDLLETVEKTSLDQLLGHYIDKQDPTRLVLGDEGITDYDLNEYIIPFLFQHPEIKTIALADNHLTDKGAIAILTKVLTLQNIGLNDNRLRNEDDTFTQLGPTTAKVAAAQKHLLRLDLSYSNIGDEGFAAFKDNTTLQELWVRGCDITKIGAQQAAQNVGLVKLYVDENLNLGDAGALALGNIKTLKEFSATYCGLTYISTLELQQERENLEVNYGEPGTEEMVCPNHHNAMQASLKLFAPVVLSKDLANSAQDIAATTSSKIEPRK